jgi:hypothetical protein
MDGYKDGDRRRSDALEVTRPFAQNAARHTKISLSQKSRVVTA